jgi:hypothetical protein
MQYFYRTQTLTTLAITMNGIGDLGAKYLAEALSINKVSYNLNSFLNYSILVFIIDTYNINN